MMIKQRKINCLLTLMSVVIFASASAFALDITQQDFGKSGGKAADQVQKQRENYQQTMERITQNKYTTAVGDGVKSAQSAMGTVQQKMSDAMGAIANAQNKFFNATETQLLMLTQQRSAIKGMIKDLEASKKEQLALLDENLKVEQSAWKEKISLSQQNVATATSVYEEELNSATTEDEKERIEKEIEQLQQGAEIEQEGFEENIKKLEEDFEAQKKSLEDEYANQIYSQKEQLADINKKYEELILAASKDKGEIEDNPSKLIESSIQDLSFKKTDKISLQDRKDKERSRKRKVTSTSISSFGTAARNAALTDQLKAQQKIISDLGETQLGQSEALHAAIKSTANQLDGLYNYLLTELKGIETETALILSKSTILVGDVEANTDICHYNGKRGGLLGAMDAVMAVQSTAVGAVATAAGTVNNAATTVSTVTETATNATSTATGMLNDTKNAAGNIGMH